MENNESELGSFPAGFVIGALVGAATAFHPAPQSGESTRHQIISTSDELRHRADSYTREYRDKANAIFQTPVAARRTLPNKSRTRCVSSGCRQGPRGQASNKNGRTGRRRFECRHIADASASA